MYRNHLKCRACDSTELVPVFDLGVQPLANSFCTREDVQSGFAPLKVLFCPRCTLAQLSVVVDPAILYSKYNYVTSPTLTMRNHFDRLFDDLGVNECKAVVEIGSNDGRLLKQWTQRKPGLRVMGIDPAVNLSHRANSNGIVTFCGVLNSDSARAVASSIQPDLVIARHCFCHADNWHDFIHSLSLLGHEKTRYVIEVPYVADQLASGDFGQIYHEHLSYLSVKAMTVLLAGSPLCLDSVYRYPIHGGVVVMTLRRRNASLTEMDPPNENVTVDTWSGFCEETGRRIRVMKKFDVLAYSETKTVCGFGASARSTVWLNACGLKHEQIKFLCDANPLKQGMLSPGSDIPIVGEDALLAEKPDYAINFAYGFTDEIMVNHKAYTDGGGKFVVPLPELKVLPA